eukprot:GFKZ01009911.1.p1 GENE.GFKZ01009911.1~~GFKZ01009911.1.p1  ORF type:complete len:1461 (+),score=197.51 GFKZ01009911.1:281-4384(+)
MTNTVALAAASEATQQPHHVTPLTHEINFALPLQPHTPKTAPVDDNTVILKIDATDSDLDDLPPAPVHSPPAPPIRRKRRAVKRVPLSPDTSGDESCLREDLPTTEIMPGGKEDTVARGEDKGNCDGGRGRGDTESGSDDVPLKVVRKGAKRMRMTTRASAAARTSPSSGGEERENGVTPAATAVDAPPVGARKVIVKGGRRGRGGRGGGRRKVVMLKLRCRPPQIAEDAGLVTGAALKEEKEVGGVKEEVMKDAKKGKATKGKVNDKYKGMTPAERDEMKKLEKFRRMAKARSAKAIKRREAKLREKGAASAANVAAGRPEPPPAEKPDATAESIDHTSVAHTVPADSEITPSAAVVKSSVRSSGIAPEIVAVNGEIPPSPRPRHGDGKVVTGKEQLRGKAITQTEKVATDNSGSGGPEECSIVLKASSEDAGSRNVIPQGEAGEVAAEAHVVDGVRTEDDSVSLGMAKLSVSEHSKSYMASDGNAQARSERREVDANSGKSFGKKTNVPRPPFGVKAENQMAAAEPALRDPPNSSQFSDEVQPVYVDRKDPLVAPSPQGNEGDRNSTFATHGSDGVRKAYVGIEKSTTERRTIARMATTMQSVRADANPNSVPSRWGSMSLDAKNEALLTFAKEQKGNIRRRPSSASCSLDRDTFSRSAKHLGRTDNVPESERKRIQVTAMVAESRVRSSSIAGFHEPLTSLPRGSTIGRLLQDPTASPSFARTNATATSPQIQTCRDPSANHVTAMDVGYQAPGRKPTVENFPNAADQAMQRNIENAGFASRVPDIHDARASGIQVADYTSAQAGTSPRAGSGRHIGFWGVGPHHQAEAARDVNRLPTVNPSSQSGSHSEPGSSAAGTTTMVHTFKRTRKRPTLAVVHRTSAQGSGAIGSDFARSTSWRSRVPEEPQAVYDNRSAAMVRGDIRVVNQMVCTAAKPAHQLPAQDPSPACMPSQLGNNPSDLPGVRSTGDLSEVGVEARPRGHLYPHESSKEPHWPRAHKYAGRAAETNVVRRGSDAPGSSIQYQVPASTHVHRGADGGGEMQRVSHLAPAETSDPAPQHSLRESAGLNGSLYRGGLERSNMEDGGNFPETSRRLRMSVGPTLPTATRRFNYEQGRQLARFSPSAGPAEQQAYSSLRRRSSAPRLSEGPTQVHTTEWDPRGEEHASGTRTAQVQSEFTSQGSGGPVLSHEYISQEGVRPSLAPVPPVVYEPEGNVRTQTEMRTGGDDIPRLHDAHRSPMRSMRPTDGSYKSQPMSSTDYGRPVHRNQHVSQSREATATLRNLSSGDSPRAHMNGGTREIGVVRTGMRGGAEVYAGSQGRVLRPTSAAFSPISLPNGGPHQDEPGTARSMQQSRPPRTDPSLKNLLT